VDGRTGRWEDGKMGGREDGRTGGRKDGRTGGWEDGRTGGREDGRMLFFEQIFPDNILIIIAVRIDKSVVFK